MDTTQEQIVGFLAEAKLRYEAVEAAKAAARVAQAAVREANKAVRVLRKMIQRAGVDLLEFDILREDAKREPAALELRDAERGRWREWAGIKSTIILPPEAQPFQLAPPEEKITQEQAEQIAAAGHKAALDNKTADANPYEAGSQKGGQWLAAWKLGLSERKLRSEAAASKPSGQKRPRFYVTHASDLSKHPLANYDDD